MIKSNRYNRAQVQWMKILKPFEYVLIDKMLFQSNLTDANNGTGFMFHVRQLEKECNISRSTISEALSSFPFIIKNGNAKGMTIQLDYNGLIKWIDDKMIVRLMDNKQVIVRLMDNDCPPNEPISKKEECTCKQTLLGANALDLIIPVNNTNNDGLNKVGIISGSNNINMPSAVSVGSLYQHRALAHNEKPIVRLMDNQCIKYILDNPLECPLPKGIKNIPSSWRNKKIVGMINDVANIKLALLSKGCQRDGYSFTAIDDTNKWLLITANDKDYIENPKIQRMIKHFKDKEYKSIIWVGCNQTVYDVIKEKTIKE